MTSTFAVQQPRSTSTAFCRRSTSTLSRSNETIKIPVRWRSSTLTRRRQHLRESGSRFKLQSPGVQVYYLKNEERRLPELGKPHLPKSFYIDQQIGEIHAFTTDRTAIDEINEDGETLQMRRRRACLRTQSDTSSPRAFRCVWDQSLKTTSIPINSRDTPSSAENVCRLSRVANPYLATSTNTLPRISKSAENIAMPPSSPFEITTRYPRGQQRPTGLASGHHALLLRHREIVEASRKTRNPWRQRKKFEEVRSDRFDFTMRHLNKSYPSHFRVPEFYLPMSNATFGQKRCGQEVKSFMKANQKCLEWFNTWVDD